MEVKKGSVESNERRLLVTLTKEGEQLKKKAVAVPDEMQGCIPLEKDELIQLKICLTRR